MDNKEEMMLATSEEEAAAAAQDGTEELSASVDDVQNTGVAVQESPKLYSEEELEAKLNAKLDEMKPRIKKREAEKARREYERKYGELESTLKAGTGMKSVEEMNETFKRHYEERGINIPKAPEYSDKELAVLAKAEADEIIAQGFEEVVEEVDRLTSIGLGNMSAKEKQVFYILAENRSRAERGRELASIGVKSDVYESEEFRTFASKFNPQVPVKEIYGLYAKTTQPKKEIKTIGSLKNTDSSDGGVKEYYSPEEVDKFTVKDYNNDPKLYKAVINSMSRWKKH